MGRPRKPAVLLKFEKRSHKTKAEIAERLEGEIKIGSGSTRLPAMVRRDPTARAKWREIMKIYQASEDMQLIGSADGDILAAYCLAFSDYKRIREENDPENRGVLIRLEGLLLKMRGELFLTPLSRVRNTIKKRAPKAPGKLEKSGFGDL